MLNIMQYAIFTVTMFFRKDHELMMGMARLETAGGGIAGRVYQQVE
jgi:hypothetical protein